MTVSATPTFAVVDNTGGGGGDDGGGGGGLSTPVIAGKPRSPRHPHQAPSHRSRLFAGIAVGGGVGVIAIALVAFFMCRGSGNSNANKVASV